MKRKFRVIVATVAAFFIFPTFSVAAYAGGGDNDYCEEQPPQQQIIDITPQTETPSGSATVTVTDNVEADSDTGESKPVTEIPIVTESRPVAEIPPQEPDADRPPDSSEQNPFTPSGTGAVVDRATDGDGKEFYTITTPDENTFYLVIDRQRTTENVYFLNAATESDLLSLAKTPIAPALVEPPPPPVEPEPTPEPAPEKSGGMGMMLLVVVIVVVGGGAGYYFKIYRPKQEQADNSDDFEGEDYGADDLDAYDGAANYDGADWDAVYDEPDEDGGE